MTAATYHQLDTPTPALSASIARVLLGQSPLHAWYAHPLLNPGGEREEKDAFDLGRAAHSLILEGESNVVIIDAADYRTGLAKAQRDEARAAGKTPLLKHRWADVQEMANAVVNHLDEHLIPRPLTCGKAEQTLTWEEDGIPCKARLDWLHDDFRTIDDLKTTENAHPDHFTRGPLFGLSYDLQASWYIRGVKAVTGVEAEFRFVLCETRPPYAVSVVGLGPDVLMLAEKKVRRALELWRECVRSGRFPGYPSRTCYAELPPWIEASWLNREMRDEQQASDEGRAIGDLLAGMGDVR